MKLKYKFEMVDMSDQIIAVPVGDGTEELQGVIRLNNAGKEIFELLMDDIDEKQIVNCLSEKYENSYETLTFYTRKVIDILNRYNFLVP